MCLNESRTANTLMQGVISIQEAVLKTHEDIAKLVASEAMCDEMLESYVELSLDHARAMDAIADFVNAYARERLVKYSEETISRNSAHHLKVRDALANDLVMKKMNELAKDQRRAEIDAVTAIFGAHRSN